MNWKRIFTEIFIVVIITLVVFGSLTYTASAMGKYCTDNISSYPQICYLVRPDPAHRPDRVPPDPTRRPDTVPPAHVVTPTSNPYPNP